MCMCQRDVPSKGLWGRGGAATLEGGLRYTPSGAERATSRTCKKRTNRNSIVDPWVTAQSGNGDFEFASILSLVLTSS